MPWSGSAGSKTFARTDGTRNGTQVWQDAEAAAVDIVSDDHDTHDQDIATGVNTCLTKDGGNTATADIPMGGFTLTGIATPGAAAEPVSRVYAEDFIVAVSSELTISTGSVTPTKSRHTIDTESDAATDNLDNIVTTNMRPGQILMLYAEDAARVVTVRDSQTGAGEIHLINDSDVTLEVDHPLVLCLRDGTDWYEVLRPSPGKLVQRVIGTYATYANTTTVINFDDTIPQNTEGAEAATVAITPTNTSNILRIRLQAMLSTGVAQEAAVALFQDSTADALAVAATDMRTASAMETLTFTHEMTAGTTSSTTFKMRYGPATASALYINGSNTARLFGGIATASIIIDEITP